MDIYKAVTIMLVEDDPGDQKLIKTSLKSQHITNTPLVVSSGEEALEYLQKTKINNENIYVHSLNGTIVTTSRTIISIYENFQNEDGSINIPTVLQKWMGKSKIETK